MTDVAEGTLVDGRYRISSRIGSGGMADVYCAEDTHLGRNVALKMLHRRFAQDQEFVERFRREASAAAGLQHPNVVGVFDRGQHDGTYYIAMEHLEGYTLKEIVAEHAPLPQDYVIDLGMQILQAAGFAHRHGVIHRDFKPHNVILDERGHAKVTDFGIARAGASEMTETGSIMGTAQYLSPEQAQGHAVTAASDLYSIGVMLYEMLAGRLPFAGDSAVAVALKHLSESPAPISQLRPDVHPALESVVMAALAKDPARRWQSAEDFAQGLEAARLQMESGEGTGQDTAAFAPIAAGEPAGDADATRVATATPMLAPVVHPQPERKKRWPWFAIGLLTLALAAFLTYLAVNALTATETREVPRVEGKQLLEAREILERAGFEVDDVPLQSPKPVDQVLDQDPEAAAEAEVGSTVVLEVSSGPGIVRVPFVSGLREEVAVRRIKRRGLKPVVSRSPSESVQEGRVIRTSPGGGEPVERREQVRLMVSSGPEQVEVPDVTGLSRDSADSRLRADGFAVDIVESESDEQEGDVIAQDPAAGTRLDRGSTVTITVSTGKAEVQVRDVIGSRARDAAQQISAQGLVPVQRTQEVTDPAQDGVVIEQRPGAGTTVEEGTEVILVVGELANETLTPTEPETP
jgi:serine/threonine-protein kinase